METLVERSSILQNAHEIFKKFTRDDELREIYEASIMNSKWVHYTRPSQAFFSPCLFS